MVVLKPAGTVISGTPRFALVGNRPVGRLFTWGWPAKPIRAGGIVVVGLTRTSMLFCRMTLRTTRRRTSRILMFWVIPADARSTLFSQFFIAATRVAL